MPFLAANLSQFQPIFRAKLIKAAQLAKGPKNWQKVTFVIGGPEEVIRSDSESEPDESEVPLERYPPRRLNQLRRQAFVPYISCSQCSQTTPSGAKLRIRIWLNDEGIFFPR